MRAPSTHASGSLTAPRHQPPRLAQAPATCSPGSAGCPARQAPSGRMASTRSRSSSQVRRRWRRPPRCPPPPRGGSRRRQPSQLRPTIPRRRPDSPPLPAVPLGPRRKLPHQPARLLLPSGLPAPQRVHHRQGAPGLHARLAARRAAPPPAAGWRGSARGCPGCPGCPGPPKPSATWRAQLLLAQLPPAQLRPLLLLLPHPSPTPPIPPDLPLHHQRLRGGRRLGAQHHSQGGACRSRCCCWRSRSCPAPRLRCRPSGAAATHGRGCRRRRPLAGWQGTSSLSTAPLPPSLPPPADLDGHPGPAGQPQPQEPSKREPPRTPALALAGSRASWSGRRAAGGRAGCSLLTRADRRCCACSGTLGSWRSKSLQSTSGELGALPLPAAAAALCTAGLQRPRQLAPPSSALAARPACALQACQAAGEEAHQRHLMRRLSALGWTARRPAARAWAGQQERLGAARMPWSGGWVTGARCRVQRVQGCGRRGGSWSLLPSCVPARVLVPPLQHRPGRRTASITQRCALPGANERRA
jgi:hypothetical protein